MSKPTETLGGDTRVVMAMSVEDINGNMQHHVPQPNDCVASHPQIHIGATPDRISSPVLL